VSVSRGASLNGLYMCLIRVQQLVRGFQALSHVVLSVYSQRRAGPLPDGFEPALSLLSRKPVLVRSPQGLMSWVTGHTLVPMVARPIT
jgi:hypothetical protein